MQDECKVYMESFLHGIDWIIFHGHLIIFKNHLLEVGLTMGGPLHCQVEHHVH